MQLPSDMEADDPSLVHGAVNGGTAQLHQQLVFRPLPGLGRAEMPIDGLYLANSSAHPGGGVHGARRARRRAGGDSTARGSPASPAAR